MTYTEKIQNRLEQGYTITLYGTREAMYERMCKDLYYLIAENRALTLTAVSHQRGLLNWMKRNNHLGKTEEQIEEILLDYNFESI